MESNDRIDREVAEIVVRILFLTFKIKSEFPACLTDKKNLN